MQLAIESTRIERCFDAIYDAAFLPNGWTAALSEIALLFNSSFADICSWTPDRQHVSGTAIGLDTNDYNEQLLGFWFNRNVWGQKSPVRMAGEVISTRKMVPREDLRRSEMYHEYLEARGLHEGMRMSLWVERDTLADVSLLRPWSIGAFGPAEIALGRTLFPHIRRAALLTRKLRQAEFRLELDGASSEAGQVAAVAFDRDGVPIACNKAAEAAFAHSDCLRLTTTGLCALSINVTAQLSFAVARAAGRAGSPRKGSNVSVLLTNKGSATTVIVQPLSQRAEWSLPRPPAAVALFQAPAQKVMSAPFLQRTFGLTTAEAQLALDLVEGATLSEVAAQTGRSRNTVRTHLANVMNKTRTSRQTDLIRLLHQFDVSQAFTETTNASLKRCIL